MPTVNTAPILPPAPQPTPSPAAPAPTADAGNSFASTLDKQLKQGTQQDDPAAQNADPATASPADAAAIAAALLAGLAGAQQQAPTPPEGTAVDPAEAAAPPLEGLTATPALPTGQQSVGAVTTNPDGESADTTNPDASQPGKSAGALPAATAAATPAEAAKTAKAEVQGEKAGTRSFENVLDSAQNALPTAHAANGKTDAAQVLTDAPQYTVRTPVSETRWANEVGDRMVWMAGKKLDEAQLVLTPPHLGRVEIKLSISGDQATAAFTAATPAAREAIEQSLPRLREVMSAAGLDLGQVNVSTNNAGQEGQQRWQGLQAAGTRGGNGADDEGDAIELGRGVPVRVQSGLGMVDTFA
ncbi:flagellar hook-length control protein FliK [Niveibacterium sp. SC-1]|uniref:flagellar hook-length control protein FliK n=1 Tax=Niveibacterium sp. SC-1 TaxID=3135646 RepID=UPI00311D77FC